MKVKYKFIDSKKIDFYFLNDKVDTCNIRYFSEVDFKNFLTIDLNKLLSKYALSVQLDEYNKYIFNKEGYGVSDFSFLKNSKNDLHHLKEYFKYLVVVELLNEINIRHYNADRVLCYLIDNKYLSLDNWDHRHLDCIHTVHNHFGLFLKKVLSKYSNDYDNIYLMNHKNGLTGKYIRSCKLYKYFWILENLDFIYQDSFSEDKVVFRKFNELASIVHTLPNYMPCLLKYDLAKEKEKYNDRPELILFDLYYNQIQRTFNSQQKSRWLNFFSSQYLNNTCLDLYSIDNIKKTHKKMSCYPRNSNEYERYFPIYIDEVINFIKVRKQEILNTIYK
ncbi:hypothetical protein [Mycoplasma sp. P36-A1]|uniref:hypothetical protein n=1 Tax=Mycoplasma sp. P36-A1 TaxID=3252900 RepID=UPI003C2BCFED